MDKPIEVPREKNKTKITKDIEAYLLDIFSKNNTEAFHLRDLATAVKRRFANTHGSNIDAHIAWALDMLHANRLIKRVGPNVWEADEGPDDAYSERETGHAPEGEFAQRGRNFNQPSASDGGRKEFNQDLGKAELSVKMLKNAGRKKDDIISLLNNDRFNPLAVKLAIQKHFGGPQI